MHDLYLYEYGRLILSGERGLVECFWYELEVTYHTPCTGTTLAVSLMPSLYSSQQPQ